MKKNVKMKKRYRRKTRYSYIERGLTKLLIKFVDLGKNGKKWESDMESVRNFLVTKSRDRNVVTTVGHGTGDNWKFFYENASERPGLFLDEPALVKFGDKYQLNLELNNSKACRKLSDRLRKILYDPKKEDAELLTGTQRTLKSFLFTSAINSSGSTFQEIIDDYFVTLDNSDIKKIKRIKKEICRIFSNVIELFISELEKKRKKNRSPGLFQSIGYVFPYVATIYAYMTSPPQDAPIFRCLDLLKDPCMITEKKMFTFRKNNSNAPGYDKLETRFFNGEHKILLSFKPDSVRLEVKFVNSHTRSADYSFVRKKIESGKSFTLGFSGIDLKKVFTNYLFSITPPNLFSHPSCKLPEWRIKRELVFVNVGGRMERFFNPLAYWSKLKSIKVWSCPSHRDLHFKNILPTKKSGTTEPDCKIIDLEKYTEKGLLFFDRATLEVNIKRHVLCRLLERKEGMRWSNFSAVNIFRMEDWIENGKISRNLDFSPVFRKKETFFIINKIINPIIRKGIRHSGFKRYHRLALFLETISNLRHKDLPPDQRKYLFFSAVWHFNKLIGEFGLRKKCEEVSKNNGD